MTEVRPEAYTPEMRDLVDQYAAIGVNAHIVVEGYPMDAEGHYADGITIFNTDGTTDVFLQVVGAHAMPERSDHEKAHVVLGRSPAVKEQAIAALGKAMSEKELLELVNAYLPMYGSAYANSEDLVGDLLEEIICDAYANLDRANAGAPKYHDAVSGVIEAQLQSYSASYGQDVTLTDDAGNLVVESDGNGRSTFSMSTYQDSGRDILTQWMGKAVVNGDLTQQDADDIINTMDLIYDICEEARGDYAPFDAWSEAKVVVNEQGNPVFSVVKANGDYAMNLDFSLVCKKRRTLDAVLNELVKQGFVDNLALNEKQIVKINDLIRSYGFEVACDLCFVDAKRYRQGKVADDFVKLYNDLVQSMIPKGSGLKPAYFNFGQSTMVDNAGLGIHELPDDQLDFTKIEKVLKEKGEKTVEYKTAMLLKTSPADRKLTMRGDFLSTRGFDELNLKNPRVLKLFNAKKGSGGPKSAVSDVQYLNEVLTSKTFTPEKAYAVGGVRIQSFSDYVPRMVFDYVQMIADLAAKKLPAHAYTKEELFVKQFGLTGMKINMSLIPKVVEGGIAPGLDADGNYAWANESFNFDEAKKIQKAEGYSRNCGTIAVGVSDEHIRKLMADPEIRMVIPYHKSGLNPVVAKMNKINTFVNYTDFQNTRRPNGKNGKKLDKDVAADKKLLSEMPDFNTKMRELGDPRAAAEFYVRWCEENGLLPKFDQFAYKTIDGMPVEKDGKKVVDENYYKLLEDFTVYDKGQYVGQTGLTMTFPTKDSAFGDMKSLIKRGLSEDALLEAKRDEDVPKIVADIKQMKFSAVDETAAPMYRDKDLAADPDVYTYSFLTAQPDMIVTEMPSLNAVKVDGNVSREKAVELGFENARRVGITEGASLVSVKNRYTGRNIRIGEKGLRHSLDGDNISRLRTNARLSAVAGDIIQNALPVNALKNKKSQLDGTYAMAALLSSGDKDVVAIVTVERARDNVLDIDFVDIAHSINGRLRKTEQGSWSSTRDPASTAASASSTISVADFLEIVKETHQSILSADVLAHFGEIRNPVGNYVGQVKFSAIDADYMAAVERGDMETAQQMVDEAAKAAGYKTLAYHGSPNNNITVFDGWRGVSYFTDAKRYADAYAWNTESGERILRAKRARKKLNNRFTEDVSGMPMEFDAMDSVAIPEDYDGETGKFFADGNSDAIYYASGEDEYKQVAGWHTELVLGEMPVATKETTARIEDLKSRLDALWAELDRARKAETEFLRTFMSDGGNVENAAQEYARLKKKIDSIGDEINATEREIFQLTPKRGKSVLKVKRGVGEAETEFRNEMQQIINAANGAETPRIYRLFLKMQNPYISHSPFDGNEFSARFNNGSDVEYTDRAIRKLQKLKDERYDGIIAPSDAALMNAFDDDYWEDVHDYIVFDSKQVKSADPVTYDDDGNVIPLSKRFQTASPDIRYSVTPAFEKWYQETYNEELTNSQLKRRLQTAERRAEQAEHNRKAAELKNTFDKEMNLTAWMMHHTKKMREQKRTMNEKLAEARKEKTEAVRAAVAETKEIERAKAAVQHDADRMAERRNAAKRLRIREDAYKQKVTEMKENQKLKRNAARAVLRDSKLAAKRRAEIEAEQGLVDTLRKNPKQRTGVEKLQDAAQALRTLGRSAYRNFVNMAEAIDRFSKRQAEGMRAGTLVNILGGTASTVESMFKKGLVDRAGNRIGESMSDVFLCWDEAHKNVNEELQAVLQDFMLHRHNIDRMSIVARAESALETFENTHEWLRDMDSKEFARLVAMTEKEAEKSGKQEAQLQAFQYARLIREFTEAQNKPIFKDDKGNPVTAETSQKRVDKYIAENPWLLEKANGIYEWWDKFMREWAVGDTISEAEYSRMRQMYPHYVPTYRTTHNGVGGAGFVGNGAASVSKAVKKAKGSTEEVMNIEDSFSNLVSKIVRLNRLNEMYMNIVDTAMLDEDGLFSDMAYFDWDWQAGQYGNALVTGSADIVDLTDTVDETEKAGLEKVGPDEYKLTAWRNGRKYTAYISKDLYQSIGNVTGHLANDLEEGLLKIGNTLTGPMKTAITGINPTFAVRNLSRDLPTAIINSISGLAFPKYYAQAAKEIAQNSEHWQQFQALGGTNATYYNDSQGWAKAMAKGKNLGSKAVGAMGAFNEVTESQTRFAEYLATIDRLGDTYENRLQGIKNAAEVTVDFSRKGRYGKVINAWVPYWNPAVQGIDKTVRSLIESPDGSAIWKQASKTLGRAAMTTILFESILQAVLHGLDRDDEWEELNDRTKDTYYCIPLKDSKTFLKIPKNREWGAVLGTPFMRMLEYANGREDPFENYIETSIEPNFLPPAILRIDENGLTSDMFGVSQALDLARNEDFAGRTIVPYAYQQGTKREQYDSDTSEFSKLLSNLIGNKLSPMQIDYIIGDYFGDFGEMFIQATSEATLTGEQNPAQTALDIVTSPFVADARYSNYAVSKYYDTLNDLDRVVQDRKNQLGIDEAKKTIEYQTQKALNELYGKAITELNREVREMADGPEKDAAKEQIAQLAEDAVEFYNDSISGKIPQPELTANYANYSQIVSDELIRMNELTKEYNFKPRTSAPKSYVDPRNKKNEFVLTEEQQDYYMELYIETYNEEFERMIQSRGYKNAKPERKAEMLEDVKQDVADTAKEELIDWLRKNGIRSTPKK